MEGGSRHSGVPRILDVQQYASARGPEIAALHAVSRDSDKPGSGSSIPRHLRRRATSHNRRRSYYSNSKKRSAAVIQDSSAQPKSNSQTGSETAEPGSYAGALPQEEPQKKRPCRRVRRKFELKGGADGSGGCSSDGTRRLVTHVWHAKRFSMTKIWGYWLPEGLPGRGRGSRAVMRWARDATLLQDASFYSPVELSGPSEALLHVLQLVLEPPPPAVNAMSDNAKAEYEGLQYGKFMLHHMDRSPYAAIAPVTLLWRPVPKELQSEQSVGLIPAEKRQVWVWVHAAAFDEALMCLQTACQRQASIGSIVLQCKSRKGDFGRLDLLGHGALAVLKKVLHPMSRSVTLGYLFTQENSAEDTCAINTSSSSSSLGLHSKLLAGAAWLPGAGVLGMEVWDPRDPPHNQAKFEALPLLGSDQGTGPSSEQMGHGRADSENILADQAEQKHGCGEVSDLSNLCLINGQSIVDCPISEKDLSTRRHKERMMYFQLSETPNGPLRVEGKMHGSPKCPILLLKHEHKMLSACGWSLILPIAWVRAFWVPLVFAGGHVIGLRERHWLSTDAGLPSFPYDFPDCFAYSQFMARQAAELQEQCSKRPLPNKRGPSSPSPPFWRFSVGPGSGISSQETEELAVNMGDHLTEDLLANGGKTRIEPRNSTRFESRLSAAENIEGPLMFVARTITTLMNTLRDNNLHHLPILPDETRPGNFNSLETGRVAWHQAVHDGAQESTKGCLVRVLIRAPRKGNFDAGAIIYMPIPADEESYLCSLQESDGLNVCAGPLETGTKLSQVEQGKVHHQPCNVRSPIGIVTSSVPRGSASTSSVGICEVGGLGMLRARQFLDEKWTGQSEIFLLVRNTTSSMYRPALAGIVLEKQTDVL
ncbi:unnamed protein product [Sphagnum tenellum]